MADGARVAGRRLECLGTGRACHIAQPERFMATLHMWAFSWGFNAGGFWYGAAYERACKLDVKQRRVQLRQCDSSSDHLRRVSMAAGTLTTKVAAYASAQEGRSC